MNDLIAQVLLQSYRYVIPFNMMDRDDLPAAIRQHDFYRVLVRRLHALDRTLRFERLYDRNESADFSCHSDAVSHSPLRFIPRERVCSKQSDETCSMQAR